MSQKKKIKTTEDVEIDKNQIPDFENNYISEPIYEKSSLPIKKKSSKNKNEGKKINNYLITGYLLF